jgi:polyhydroxyalkanoate synthesis regulator phasin
MTQDPPKDKTKALYDELGIPMPNAQETQGKVDPAPSEEKPSSDKKQALYDALGISSNVGAPRIKPPVEQPFTEAPAQGPQTPQQKFEQAIPAGPSMPSATQQEPLSGTLTDSRGPSVVDTPKANYELPPETADISKAKPYGEAFSKQEVATAGPGRSEKAEEDRLFLDRFADLDLKGIEKYKDEVLPRQMNVLKQAQAGYNADDKQVGFSEVDLLGLKQQAERDPSLIPEYEQRVKEHNGMVSSLNKQKMAILDLVGAYERDEKLLSMQELLLKREKGSWGGAVWNSILQGEGDVLSGMAGAAANKLLGLESDKNSVLGSLIFPKGFMAKHLGYEPGTTPDEIAKDFRENTLSEMRGVPKEKLGSEGTTDEYIANKSEGFWGGAFLGLARSAPAMATPAMSGIGFQVFDGTMEEMSGPGFEGVSEEEKMDVAVPISLISVALEKFGFRNLSKSTPVVGEIYKRVLAKVPANATATQIENAVNGEVSGWVSNSLGKLAGGAASEFETGFFQEGATMAAKDLYDITAAEDGKGFQLGNSWRDYAKNMFYSGAQEAAGGMMMATPYAVSAAIKKNEVGKITSDTQYELVEELATDPNFRTTFEAQQAKDVEEGRITPEQSEEIKTDFATARKIVEKIPDDLPVTSKREAFDILSQIDKLSKKDADLVGDKVQALRERLKGLQGVPKVEEAKTDAEGKKVEVKPTEPTGNETKERSTLAETKEDGELHNIPKGGEVQNNAADIQGQSSVSDTKDVTPTERGANKSGLTNEVLQSPVSDQAATDPSTEASSEVQPQEQPATPEPVSNKPGEGKGTKESPYITRSGKKYGNFEITRDPDTGKNTIKPRSKSKDTWSKLPDKLAAKEYRAHKKRLLQAMRDAEVEFSKSTGHPINPRTGDPIGDGKRKKAERVSYQKEVDRKAGELSTTDKGTFGIALAWLSDGNTKISPESVRAYLGWGAGRNEGANAKYRVTEEEKNSKWILAKEGRGKSISDLAHDMWEENLVDGETLPGYETTDFEEAIASVVSGYKNTDEAYSALDELVRDNSPLDVDEQVRAYYEAQMANVTEEDVTREDIERTDAYIDKLTEDELDKLWEEKNAFEAEAANVGTEQGDTVSVPDQQGSKRAETGKEGKVTAKIKGISTEAQKEIDEALGLSSTDNSGALAQKPTNTRTINTGKLRTDRVVAALKKLVPNLKIVAPKTNNGYAEATKDIGEGLESTWGIYDPRTNKLYLNPSSPDLRQTLFHEAAHPIIIALAKNKPELFSKFYDQVRTEKGGKYTKFGQQYSDLSEAAQMAEALAEFFGDVVSGRVPVSTKPDSLYQQFKDFLKDILAALGWDMRSIDLGKPTDVREFAAQMKKAFDKGIKIEGFEPSNNKEAKMALQDDADRLVDGWYSRLDQAVAAKGNTQSGADWMKWAEARAKEGMLSMEEAKWTGLAEFLDGKNKVTSQEVRDFLKENRVKVEVVEKGGGGSNVDIVENTDGTWSAINTDTGEQIGVRSQDRAGAEEEAEAAGNESTTTKFSQYQLPGGTNYREVLVTLPTKAPSGWTAKRLNTPDAGFNHWQINDANGNEVTKIVGGTEDGAIRKAAEGPQFRSSHFDEPNILVHLRVNDRTDADGKKVLFIEELQSDWGQKGKKGGFAGITTNQFRIEDNTYSIKQYNDGEWGIVDKDGNDKNVGFGTREEAEEYQRTHPRSRGGFVLIDKVTGKREPGDYPTKAAAEEAGASIANKGKAPSAPFVTDTNSWVELGLKQAIRMAVEGGYDRIAWTNGEQQNERYDLSKQVDRISWEPDRGGSGEATKVAYVYISNAKRWMSLRPDGTIFRSMGHRSTRQAPR